MNTDLTLKLIVGGLILTTLIMGFLIALYGDKLDHCMERIIELENNEFRKR